MSRATTTNSLSVPDALILQSASMPPCPRAGYWVLTSIPAIGSLGGTEDPAYPTDVCENNLPGKGLEEVFWRDYPSAEPGLIQNVCRWPQFSPPNTSVPDGWYYALGTYGNTWPRERSNAPRDMYLKLEYNPADDLRQIPDCLGFVYESCEAQLRNAGFTDIRRVDPSGRDIDFTRPPDAVSRTAPTSGSLVPVNTEIAVYANPPEKQHWASFFQPILRFDTSERWRPLSLGVFFAERNPDGSARHSLCNDLTESLDCVGLIDASQLSDSLYDDTADFIDMQSQGGTADEDDFVTPHGCREPGLQECEQGGVAATYFQRVRSPGGYDVYDYWWYFRFNDVPDAWHDAALLAGDPLMHEGDWEGVSVGVTPGGRTFDYAAFSQHGTWYGYLKEAMQCDSGGAASCSGGLFSQGPDGRRVHAFVADGTHALYPDPCSRIAEFNCHQNGPGVLETGHDGEKWWGGNDDPATPLRGSTRMRRGCGGRGTGGSLERRNPTGEMDRAAPRDLEATASTTESRGT